MEQEKYYFSQAAADRFANFAEKYCCHYEDRWAGTPFNLLDFQREHFSKIYGTLRHDNNLRRYREVFYECSKGNGKSPLLAVCGLYELLASGEQGALVICAARDYQQVKMSIFDCAKKIIRNSPRLAAMERDGKIIINDREIKYIPTNSSFVIMSGDFEGKAGFRPTLVLLDEAWEFPNRKMYDSLTRNAKKRSQPLVIVATNSGNRKDSICWELHERAQRVVNGESKDETLYPIIYCTDAEKDNPGEPATWAKANPALDKIITTEAISEEWIKAKETPSLEAEFRRLHCGQWVEGTSKWIDMAAWDACTRPITPEEIKDLPCVVGLDMSLCDDLTSRVDVFIGSKYLYVIPHFWIPRKTAYEYVDKSEVPYDEWRKKGYVNFVEADTIDPDVQEKIAESIIDLSQQVTLRAMCYDPSRAQFITKLAEQAGVTPIHVKQGFHLSTALEEIERRWKDKTLVIAPNDCMRFCASNAEVKPGDLGGIKLVKEYASGGGSYKGRKSQKIDGIQALATAMHYVRILGMTPEKKPSVYEQRGIFAV